MLLKILLVLGTILFAFPADAETRLALIISNAAYPSEIGRLANPHKDGAVIAAGLQSVGFESDNITILRDADQPALRSAVAELSLMLAATSPSRKGSRMS